MRGWVYAAFIIDVFSRMVVGWQISESLRSDLAIDALEMAVWNRTRNGQVLDGLVHHSDRGVQYLSIRYSERLDENDIVASVGSRGDSYDNAMAEAFNSLYKWELIYPQGPGGASTTSSSPPWATSTGSTTAGSTARSPTTTPTSPQQSSKPPTTVKHNPPPRRLPNNPSSHGTRGDSENLLPGEVAFGIVYFETAVPPGSDDPAPLVPTYHQGQSTYFLDVRATQAEFRDGNLRRRHHHGVSDESKQGRRKRSSQRCRVLLQHRRHTHQRRWRVRFPVTVANLLQATQEAIATPSSMRLVRHSWLARRDSVKLGGVAQERQGLPHLRGGIVSAR